MSADLIEEHTKYLKLGYLRANHAQLAAEAAANTPLMRTFFSVCSRAKSPPVSSEHWNGGSPWRVSR